MYVVVTDETPTDLSLAAHKEKIRTQSLIAQKDDA